MEGSYPKVLTSVDQVPAPSFHYFVSMLSGTVRDSIAESSEAAYESLPLDEALRMLKISTVEVSSPPISLDLSPQRSECCKIPGTDAAAVQDPRY